MYCENCHSEQETRTVTKEQVFNVKGESIPVTGDVLLCNGCGEELFDEELDGRTLDEAYSIYRQRHGLLQPAQIEATRNHYGLSAADFALTLGMGEKTITRYENGGIQSTGHNTLLELAQQETIMRQLFLLNCETLPVDVKERVEEKLFGKRSVATGSHTPYRAEIRPLSARAKSTCKVQTDGVHPNLCYSNEFGSLAYAS